MSEDTKITACAPYGPFSTVETALNHIAALKGIPPRIDRSVFPSLGGDAKTHVLNSFRFFGLIDDKGNPQPLLNELALNKESRKAMMRRIIKDCYPNVTEADLGTMTVPQLDAKLGEKGYNVSGATRQKARSFLIKAAEFAAIPLSGLLTQKGPRGPRGPRQKRTKLTGEAKPATFNKVDNMNGHGKPDPERIQVPIALGAERIAHVDLPKDWDSKDAKKLLAMLRLALDVAEG